MLSIIICSISLKYLEALEANIRKTIGISHEIIAVDNREKRWPIAKVYNYGAQKAKYPYLFFVHEDVNFHSNGWGEVIVNKLAEPDCGVIGFGGSKVKLSSYSGWYQCGECTVNYFYQNLHNGLTAFRASNTYLERSFEEVIVLDGLGLFVRKDVWKKYPFDEELLTGFHCYDIDFTLQIAHAHFKNYVCCSNQVLIEHFSMGSMDEKWFSATICLHKKWKYLLPIKTNDVNISDKRLMRYEEKISYDFLHRILRTNCSRSDKRKVLYEFWSRPFSWKHLLHCIGCTFKYLKR